MPFSFRIDAVSAAARAGCFVTPHGPVETPAFMPVGTLATVRTLDPAELEALGARMLLANAFHLHLRPGAPVIRSLGGLHAFMGWSGPLLTDSGGFQVFSLETLRTVREDGVEFRSPVDGSKHFFTAESVMRLERALGADVIMQFDHVLPGQAEVAAARDASERSLRWLGRALDEFGRLDRDGLDGAPVPEQALFPVLQGGIHPALRREACAAAAAMHDWAGYGIGGLSVGEAKPDMYAMIDEVTAALPAGRPRYLMGVGFPEDLIEAVRRGVDLFDCVAPTRMGRNGTAFTSEGRLNVRRADLARDPRPLDERCGCSTCRRFSRAYLRHLFVAEELLGLRLLSLHNVHFLTALMREARGALVDGTFDGWSRAWLARQRAGTPPDAASSPPSPAPVP